MITEMIVTIATTARAVTMVHSQFLSRIFITAQTAMMGALIMIIRPMAVVIWICVMSLVERVMRLEVENLFISSSENDWTLAYSRSLRRLENDVAIQAASPPTMIETTRLPNAQSSIIPPSS